MFQEDIKKELKRITEELNELFALIQSDYSKEGEYASNQYNMGMMVGIGYAQQELEKLVHEIGETYSPNFPNKP